MLSVVWLRHEFVWRHLVERGCYIWCGCGMSRDGAIWWRVVANLSVVAACAARPEYGGARLLMSCDFVLRLGHTIIGMD